MLGDDSLHHGVQSLPLLSFLGTESPVRVLLVVLAPPLYRSRFRVVSEATTQAGVCN
jgi:hypothetical protein